MLRIWGTAVAAAMLLTACGGSDESDGPAESQDGPASFSHAVAAMPSDEDLPTDSGSVYRCPGADFCVGQDRDAANVQVSGEAREADGMWPGTSLSVTVASFESEKAAQEDVGKVDEGRRTESTEPEQLENGWKPGYDGTVTTTRETFGDWSGSATVRDGVILRPGGERSEPRQGFSATIRMGRTVLSCSSNRYADEGDGIAEKQCRDQITGYLDRLASLDPDEVPHVTTRAEAAAALPADGDFPEGSTVQVRCPGDDPCTEDDRQTQDASVSVRLPLPDGVADDSRFSRGPMTAYTVEGGEWTEDLWIKVFLKGTPDLARAAYDENVAGIEGTGPVDIPAEATDDGYDYGVRGTKDVLELGGDGWEGRLRVWDAEFIHLDGRITDRRFDIDGSVLVGDVLVTVDSSFTVQGRDQADAEAIVEGYVTDYVERLLADR